MMRLLPTIHESIQAGYHHTRRVEGSYQRASQCHLEMYRGILEHDSERARMAAQRHMLQTMHDSRRRSAVRAGQVKRRKGMRRGRSFGVF